MSGILLVPMCLDALHLKFGTAVAEAMVDFSRLPYFDSRRDVNPDIANLSESVVSQAFQNKNLFLKAGIHLHWALPDALTKESEEGIFPATPNRWLVTRRDNPNTSESWVVESDYLYPANVGFQEDSVTYPDMREPEDYSPRFRYLGRKIPLSQWQETDPEAEYLERLSAVGYGEPAFAAFYPNCRSVFGFHDPKYAGDTVIPEGLQYDVIGWYSDSKQNYLREFILSFKHSYQEDYNKEATIEEIIRAIKEDLQWKGVTLEHSDVVPQIICYARLTFKPPANYQGQPPLETANITLAVANTGTEALSAYLAETLDQSQKAIIEEQLEALQFSDSLENQQLDVGAKFQVMRHEVGFNAVSGGLLWTIRLEAKTTESDRVSSQATLHLPANIVSQIDTLNRRQEEYDAASAEINSRRKQLFSDWYKYMISTYPPEDSWDDYPDIDKVKFYIQTQALEPLQARLEATGELRLLQDRRGKLVGASASVSETASLASALADEINSLFAAVDAYNQQLASEAQADENAPPPPTYRLEAIASARYWEPTEPTVLMVGDAIKASQRHGQDSRLSEDGLLACETIAEITVPQLIAENFQTIFNRIGELDSAENQQPIGFHIWTEQPWNPFLLEWLVEVFPGANFGNKTAGDRNYGSNFITANYTLAEQDVDLSTKAAYRVTSPSAGEANRIPTDRDSNIYSGFSILTPHANLLLQNRIEEYLEKHDSDRETMTNPVYQVISDYEQRLQNQEPRNQQIENYLRQHIPKHYPEYTEAIAIDADPYLGKLQNIQTLKSWYEDHNLAVIPDPVFTAKGAQEHLKNLNALSQSLGGFNEALLMHKQTLQLEIEDPIGFDDYKIFTDAVREAVAGEIKSAPQPLDDFSPIRSGEMRIIDLQLVDTFGQVRNLDWQVEGEEYIITPETMKAEANNRIYLPPRFVQPIQFNFRWLSAKDENDQEMNNLAETNPICGWIIPNNLNGNLMIYSQQGQALGSINTNAEWDYAPGKLQIEPQQIPNLHLKKVVNTILTLGPEFLDHFLVVLNNALENIDPESFAQNQSLALLIGRPIAVVRASLNLEVQGLPAINQDWHIFRQEMQQLRPLAQRDTDNFTEVKFPIRIGEYQQLNDGVIGYWKEAENTEVEGNYEYENNIFYAQQSDSSESEYIETQFWDPSNNPEGAEESPINIIQSLNSPPQKVTMLIDPRGVVHATSGILPNKVIDIPAEQYAEVLANIKVTFLTSPILSDRDKLNLPLPTEPEYDWSWLEKRGTEWSEIFTKPILDRPIFLEYCPTEDGEACWQSLLEQGWLRTIENEPDQAEVVAKDERPPLTGNLTGLDSTIEEIFDLYKVSIEPVTTQATFASPQAIREGWLVLSKTRTN